MEGHGFDRGVTALADYMGECLERRKTAKGAARTMYKLLANSIIGKFAQRTEKIQVSKLYELAEAAELLIDDLVEMSYPELRAVAEAYGIKLEKFSLGQIWMPEWNGLITGHVRAQLGAALMKRGGIYCHTDSLWTSGDCPGPGWEKKGTGPATVVRTRFAALWDKESPHVAHHSVWTRAVAEQMLKKFNGQDFVRKYPKSRPIKFREGIKRGIPIGRWIEEGEPGYWHRADTRWDGKRCLLPDGMSTRPWKDLLEYMSWKEKNA